LSHLADPATDFELRRRRRTDVMDYGVPAALGVSPELMEEVSTGVSARPPFKKDVPSQIQPSFPPTTRSTDPSVFPLDRADHDHGVRVRRWSHPGSRQPDLDGKLRREQSLGQDHAGDGQRLDVPFGLGACPVRIVPTHGLHGRPIATILFQRPVLPGLVPQEGEHPRGSHRLPSRTTHRD
jgi:hypothetical protein